jgi:hypothetical protein
MEHEVRDAIEDEILTATRSVLRSLGRIGLLSGSMPAATAAEVLIGLVEAAVQASREHDVQTRDEYGDVEPGWLSPPPIDVVE